MWYLVSEQASVQRGGVGLGKMRTQSRPGCLQGPFWIALLPRLPPWAQHLPIQLSFLLASDHLDHLVQASPNSTALRGWGLESYYFTI